MQSKLKILSVGGFSGYGHSNTCLHRTWALEKIGNVDKIDTTPCPYGLYIRLINKLFQNGFPIAFPDIFQVNNQIVLMLQKKQYDIIWIDKGLFINYKTLQLIKNSTPTTLIIGYSPDEMSQRHNQSLNFIQSLAYYDYFVTTKSYAVESLYKLGAKKVLFVNNAYEDTFHYPRTVTQKEVEKLGGDVGFIGAWEQDRADSILYLAMNGINVRVWGGGKWLNYKNKFHNLVIEDAGLFSEDYCVALAAFKISLCFLRKMNSDVQTTRTMEIPACGGFLVAERTTEHELLFEEGKEASFFSTNDELLEKCKCFLENEVLRKQMVEASYKKCITAGYSNKKTVEFIINHCLNKL